MSLELILLSLERLWAPFWEPLAAWGSQGASLWLPFGSLGTPWDPLGHLGLPSGAWGDLGSKMDVLSQANVPQVARLRIKRDLAELSALSGLCAQWAQSAAGAATPNPTLPCAGG